MSLKKTDADEQGALENDDKTPEGSPAETPGQEPAAMPQWKGDEVLSCVPNVAETITGCSENEIKNFIATADFAARQVVVQLGEHWKGICKTNRNLSKDGRSAKVTVGAAIEIDHSNILYLDTKVRLQFSEKHATAADIQADLTQVEFSLGQPT
jgi:hypothetical protein